MKQMLSKCILLDFPTDFLPQKPYLCTEISKCAEIANRRTSAKNHPLTVRTLPAPPLKGGERGGLHPHLRPQNHHPRHRRRLPHRHPPTNTNHHPKRTLHPPFYRFCTITLATLATFATLAFSIHLLLRYKKA